MRPKNKRNSAAREVGFSSSLGNLARIQAALTWHLAQNSDIIVATTYQRYPRLRAGLFFFVLRTASCQTFDSWMRTASKQTGVNLLRGHCLMLIDKLDNPAKQALAAS